MGQERGAGDSRGDSGARWIDNLKHSMAFGGLLGMVLVVLLLGAVLRAEDPSPPGYRAAPAPLPLRPPAHPSEPARSADPAPDPVAVAERPVSAEESAPRRLQALARRAEDDLRRLGATGDGWTLKLATVCDPGNAARWHRELGGDSRLHFVPTVVGERTCFRLCWSSFPSRERADDERLPAEIRAFTSEAPRPVQVGAVLR